MLEPRELITPEEISSKTLASMDQAIRNFKLGQVSNPVDLSDFWGIEIKYNIRMGIPEMEALWSRLQSEYRGGTISTLSPLLDWSLMRKIRRTVLMPESLYQSCLRLRDWSGLLAISKEYGGNTLATINQIVHRSSLIRIPEIRQPTKLSIKV